MTTPVDVVRSVPLDDIAIRSGGDGRTVVAYASVFTPYEVRDGDGHYEEHIDRHMFDRHLARISGDLSRVQVMFNHGMTIHGTPSELDSLPIGVPLEVRSDDRGLLTVTRYGRSERAEAVLQSIKDGTLRAMSWSGQWIRTERGQRSAISGLPVLRRLEATLREYGPTPFPMTADASIVSVRSATALLSELEALSPDERELFLSKIPAPLADPGPGPVDEAPAGELDPLASPGSPESPPSGPSITQLANDQRRRRDAEGG